MGKVENIEIYCVKLHETEKGVKLFVSKLQKTVWVSKSLITLQIMGEFDGLIVCKVTTPKWLWESWKR